jgi:hypothetical protein
VVHDGERRAEETKALFQGFSQDFPPEPKVPAEVEKQFSKFAPGSNNSGVLI